MSTLDRRSATAWLAFAALAPLGAFAEPSRAGERSDTLAIPKGPMELSRRIERGLGDGLAVIVLRRWHCAFEPAPPGARITGKQVAAEVEAPESLARLAEIERQRVEHGLFPALLDGAGRMVSHGDGTPPDLSATVAAALDYIRNSDAAADRKVEARAFIARLNSAGAELVGRVPPDLFYPEPGSHSETRDIPVPGGSATGSFELMVEREAVPGSGLLRSIRREVVTTLGDTRRISCDEWTLKPL